MPRRPLNARGVRKVPAPVLIAALIATAALAAYGLYILVVAFETAVSNDEDESGYFWAALLLIGAVTGLLARAVFRIARRLAGIVR